MSIRRRLAMLGLMAVGLVVPAVVSGQGNLQIGLAPSVIAFDPPGIPQYDAGWVDQVGGVVVEVTSRPANRSWELRIRAVESELGQGKPVTDVLWRIEGGAWTPLAPTEAIVLQGMGDRTVPLEFRVLLDWASDGPGTYSVGIDFTVVRL